MRVFDASAHATEFPLTPLRALDEIVGDWLLVGAFARDIVVSCVAGMPRSTATEDVDIAVAVTDRSGFDGLRSRLPKVGGGAIRHRIGGWAVDVIPYGVVAPDDRFMDGATTLDVAGMAEARRDAMRVSIAPGLDLWCPQLHSLVALKLVAWSARRQSTSKDAHDVARLLEASHQGAYADEVWEDDEALAANGYLPDLAGPHRLGRLMGRGLGPSALARVAAALEGDGIAQLAADAGTSTGEQELLLERMTALREGFRQRG